MSLLKSFYQWILGPAGRQGQLSELDSFLRAFEAQRKEQPASRILAREKAAKIAALRDGSRL